MAEATNTVVPSSGVDCDDDGTAELAEGDPLVCDILDEEEEGVANLAPAILASLRAVTDEAPVELVARKGKAFIESVSPETYPSVDVKDPNTLAFTVTYACPKLNLTKGSVELIAAVRGASVAGASTSLVCKPAPVTPEAKDNEPPVVLPPAPDPAPAVVPVPPPPPAPAPVSQIQPQSNPHVQGAMAEQEQEELQLAVAAAGEAPEEQYAFSSYKRGRGPGAEALILYMSAVAMAAGAAAVRLRSRTHLARQRIR